ncbi:MAG: GNAT family N-acetyltransferase [Anaerolineae bacterium]|jgi:ribosomal protein S18 acetylase RimI-like enzyme|nr:GNAT family N-acetyltransferase [Anaerolineae bacterium]
MFKPRPYAGADDLQKLITFNAMAYGDGGATGYLHVGDIPHRIYNVLRHYNPADLVHLYEDETGNLLAWSIIMPRYPAFDVQIHPNLHGSAIEEDMLIWAINLAQEKASYEKQLLGRELITDVYPAGTIRAELLLKLGFHPTKEPFMVHARRLLNQPIPNAILPEGFIIRSAQTIHEAGQLADVHAGAFGSSWTPESYAKVMQSPGYHVEHEMVVVAPDGRFVAFCIYWLDEVNQIALFEPVGTHRDFQRMGLGRALMHKTMRRMQNAGMQFAEINYELDNDSANRLYQVIGFEPLYSIYSYNKPLE